jgi:hypothetical protein
MQILDRYLKNVGTFLPSEQREDILRELSENIRSQMEEKEAEVGRPLTESEQGAILKGLGHPLVVASRYRHDQRSVSFGREIIGPVLFPAYQRVLAWNLSFAFGIILIVFGCLLVAGERLTAQGAISVVFYQFLIQFSVITVIFALVDRHIGRHPDQWCVRRPFAVELGPELDEKALRPDSAASKGPRPVSRFDSVAIMVASVGALAWLSVVQRNQFFIFGPAAAIIGLGPVWNEALPWIVTLTFAGMIRAFVNLLRPDWLRFRDLARIAIDSAAAGIVVFLLRGREWVVPRHAGQGLEAVSAINQLLFYGSIAGVALLSGMIAFRLVSFVRREWVLGAGRDRGEPGRDRRPS